MQAVGCIYSSLIHFNPSSGLLWSSDSHRCVHPIHLMTVVRGISGIVYRKEGNLTEVSH